MKWNKVTLIGTMRTVKVTPCYSYTQNKRVLAHIEALEANLPRLAPLFRRAKA